MRRINGEFSVFQCRTCLRPLRKLRGPILTHVCLDDCSSADCSSARHDCICAADISAVVEHRAGSADFFKRHNHASRMPLRNINSPIYNAASWSNRHLGHSGGCVRSFECPYPASQQHGVRGFDGSGPRYFRLCVWSPISCAELRLPINELRDHRR